MKLWQETMIRLARSERVTRLVQGGRMFQGLAKRFVGGSSTDEAIATALRLRDEGIASSLYFLGEYVEDPQIIEYTVSELANVAAKLRRADLDVHLSVDPTQLGLLIDEGTCAANVRSLADTVAANVLSDDVYLGRDAVMLDMEDRSVTEFTLRLHDRLQDDGLPVAVTVQSYLHRAASDLAHLAERGSFVRLVKGAFAEPADVAVRGRRDIDSRFRQAIATLMSPSSLDAGTYNAFGTHDHVIIEEIINLATQHNWPSERFEFEMLYGVRPELQAQLVGRGFKVRLYVPFGQDWFPYAIRRVGESPRNLKFAVGALAKQGG